MTEFERDQASPRNILNINDLPDEILLLILDLVAPLNRNPNQINARKIDPKKSKNSFILVCKRWKSLIENYHNFHSTFFEADRNDDDFQIALESTRNYKSISFLPKTNIKKQVEFLQETLKKYEGILEEIKIGIYSSDEKSGGETSDDGWNRNEPFFMEGADYLSILESIRNLEKITLIHRNSHISDFTSGQLNCPNLKHLIIEVWDRKEQHLITDRITFLESENLEIFHFTGNSFSENDLSVQQCIFDFAIKQKNLKEFQIRHFYNFLWDKEKLEVHGFEEMLGDLKHFLRNRTKDIKILKIYNWKQRDGLDFLFCELEKLEEVESNIDLSNFHQLRAFPQIKKLTLFRCYLNQDKIYKLSRVFPALTCISFILNESLGSEDKTFIKQSFKNLKLAREINFYSDYEISKDYESLDWKPF
jgi:hypothetical protein